MERLEKFYRFVNVVLVVIVLFLEAQIVHCLEKSGIHNFWLLFVVTATLLIAFFKFGEWLVEKMIENLDWLKKLIIGDEYIEGLWIDKVEISGRNFYGLLIISMKDGVYKVNGSQYSDKATLQNRWITISSDFENYTLKTIYQTTYFDEAKLEEPYGISSYNFQKTSLHGKPLIFSGTFYDVSRDFITKSFYGFKVTDKKVINKLKHPDKTAQAIMDLIQSPFFSNENDNLGKQ